MNKVCLKYAKFSKVFERSVQILQAADHQKFSHPGEKVIIPQIAALISRNRSISKDNLYEMKKVFNKYGLTLLGEYVRLINNPDKGGELLLNSAIEGDSTAYYRYQIEKFLLRNRACRARAHKAFETTHNLERIFDEQQRKQPLIYLPSRSNWPDLSKLLHDVDSQAGAFFDSQLDLPGTFSPVWEGLVKVFTLPGGERIVSKRSESDKEHGFQAEQRNLRALKLALRFSKDRDMVDIGTDILGRRLCVTVLGPSAVISDPCTNAYYSLSKFNDHPTLETVLLKERHGIKRKCLLLSCRQILDYLYSKGVIWGDMAPRNVLLQETEGKCLFYLLDFEKTRIQSGKVSLEERLEHGRGAIFAEEFGGVYTLSEIKEAFGEYFNPDDWDLRDESVPPLRTPKRQVVDILRGRGVQNFTFGEYNRTEIELFCTRFTFTDSKGRQRHPIHLLYRIDHHGGGDYDRRAAEILLAANSFGCFEAVMDWLQLLLENYDGQRVIASFSNEAMHAARNELRLQILLKSIDELYAVCRDRERFTQAINQRIQIIELEGIRRRGSLRAFSGRKLGEANTACVASRLAPICRAISARISSPEYVVLVSGSYARREYAFGCPLEIRVIAESFELQSEVEAEILSHTESQLSMPISLRQSLRLHELPNSVTTGLVSLPEMFWSQILMGQGSYVDRFRVVNGAILEASARYSEVPYHA